jgi:hypothetical protein
MTWQQYWLVYRLCSPLRIGGRETGNLLSTQPYIPGRVLWAALTARITRDRGFGQQGSAYKQVGNELQQNLRFGYLWPSLDGISPFYRWQDQAEFDYLFLNSYVSTSLNYSVQSALDGSLHEAEYIAPFTRRGEPVFLVGDLWIKEEYVSEELIKALTNVQFGGERRYGWGRVILISIEETATGTDISNPDDFTWSKTHIPAHVYADGVSEALIQGRLEPLIGWEMSASGKKKLSSHILAYAPGASWNPEEVVEQSFRIGAMGIWRIKEKSNGQ